MLLLPFLLLLLLHHPLLLFHPDFAEGRDRRQRRIVIAFRGTCSTTNWRTDCRCWNPTDINGFFRPDSARVPAHMLSGDADQAITERFSRIHTGFWAAYCTIREEVLGVVRQCLADAEDDPFPPEVVCTGHSLGGALATLAAFDFHIQFDCAPLMYNFGSPRVGNHAFATVYNHAVPHSFRVVFDGDLFTGVPKLWYLYKHIGRGVVIDGTGNIIVDPSFVENVLHTSNPNKMSSHSLLLYRKGLFKCFDETALLMLDGH